MSGSLWDEQKKKVDGKIKDNFGKPREGGGNNRPDKTLGELSANGAEEKAAPVDLENFDGMDYEHIYAQMLPVSENASSGYQDTLHAAHKSIQEGLSAVKARIATLDQQAGWKGSTHEAAMTDLERSYAEPDEASKAAFALGTLSEYYSQIMSTNKHNIVDQWKIYVESLFISFDDADEVRRYFNTFAQDVMKNYYSPEIEQLAAHQPVVDSRVPASPVLRAKMVGVKHDDGDGKDGDGSYEDGYQDGLEDGRNGKGGHGNGSGGADSGGPGNGSGGAGNGNGGAGSFGGGSGNNGSSGQGNGSGQGSGGGNGSGAPPPFSPPNLKASAPNGGGSDGGGSSGSGSTGGGGSPGTGGGGSNSTPKQSFTPPEFKPPEVPGLGDDSTPGSDSGSGSGTGSHGGSGKPTTTDGHGAKFDPSKVLTDPKAVSAANRLLDDPKTADAAKKLLSDPKLADAAKTLFGDGKTGGQGLLGNPKALDAAKTLFGDPAAADAAKTLFGDPATAKETQKLLDDPHLKDLGKALKDSVVSPHAPGQLTDHGSSNGVKDFGSADALRDLSRSAASPAGLGGAGLAPSLASALGGSSDGQSLLGGIMDGVGQIMQTVQQAAAPQAPGFGGPGFDGVPGGPGDPAGAHPGAGHGGGGAGAGAAGPGKLHMAGAGAPIAANLTHAAHAGSLAAATDGSPAGAAGGGGAPPGGGHGGGGRGGEGKDHKGNKALRSSGNGQDLIGDSDAVVAVIGDDGSGGSGWNADS